MHATNRAPRAISIPSGLRRSLLALAVIVVILLGLPYLIAPLYRFVQPVSTPMLWRWTTGKRVDRIVVPIGRIAPTLPIAVIVAEDGTFCHNRGIDLGALREAMEEADDTRRRARRLDHYPADREEPVSLERPQLCAQSARNAAGGVDQPGAAETPRAGNLPQYRRVGPKRRVWR